MKTITLPNAQLIPAIKALIEEGHTATFRIRGYSMRPFLEDRRDKAIIAPVSPDAIKKGDVVLAEISPKHYVLHRVAQRHGHTLTLRGDGNVWGTETCQDTDVIGLATGFWRGNRKRPTLTGALSWRLYSLIWPDSPLLRRCYLAFHRRVVVRKAPAEE